MLRVLLLALLSSLALAAPLEGFGDATDAEIAEIRAGTYLEMFDENPTYNYNYKVADDVEQTYLSLEESRNDNVVTGMYSYVDPLGSLITVKYSAGAMGYTEERTEQPGFVQISARPVSTSSSSTGSSGLVSGGAGFSSSGLSSSSLSSGSSSLSSGSSSLSSGSSSLSSGSSSLSSGSSSSLSSGSSSSSLDQSALISQILAQIQPLISQTVSTAIAGQSSSSLSSESSSSSLSSGQSSSSSLSSGDDSLLILSPTSSTSSSSDLVAQILAQIGPLVAQTVSSVVGSTGPTARSEPVQPVQAVDIRSGSAASQVRALAPAPAPAPAQPAGLAVFGSGEGNNVQINHAGANVEY